MVQGSSPVQAHYELTQVFLAGAAGAAGVLAIKEGNFPIVLKAFGGALAGAAITGVAIGIVQSTALVVKMINEDADKRNNSLFQRLLTHVISYCRFALRPKQIILLIGLNSLVKAGLACGPALLGGAAPIIFSSNQLEIAQRVLALALMTGLGVGLLMLGEKEMKKKSICVLSSIAGGIAFVRCSSIDLLKG